MGALGIRIEHSDQVGDAVKKAIDSGKPCVINAILQGGKEVLAEPFRRDALEMPVRYLDQYAHLNAN
jgi:sulfoacetaldehyde acetyltransferase